MPCCDALAVDNRAGSLYYLRMSTGSAPRQRKSLRNSAVKRGLIDPSDLYPPDVVEWMDLSPAQRLFESAKLWDLYKLYGGSFEPDPDPQSPFFDPEAPNSRATDGGTGLRVIRRSGV